MITQLIKNWLLKRYYNPVQVDDVIIIDKGEIRINGEIAPKSTLYQLQAEYKALESSYIWKVMTGSVRHIAKDKMINRSLTFQHVEAGKMMLLGLDTLESIGKVIKNLKL